VPGSLPPDATEIFHEGLRLPPVRIHKAGAPVPEIIDLIMANLRLPVIARGDLNAQIASINIAERRLHELCAKYGGETVRTSFAHILDSGERLSRAGIAALPDGVFTAEDVIDGDGFEDAPIPIQVEVRIAGDEITFDFTGSSAQRRGPLNAPRSALLSAVKTVFRALVDPQAPSNEGWFRPLHIVVPDGTVFSAQYPSPVGWYYEITGHASELAWKALFQVAPERFSVGSYLSLCPTFITGTEPATGEPFALVEPHHGGWGATESNDGESALIAVSDGDTYNYSVELLEAKYPIRCHAYGLNTKDGSGAGRYRGGYGIRKEYEILADEAMFYGGMARTRTRPWGLNGGKAGSVNHLELVLSGEHRHGERVPSTAITRGDRITIATGGGGGHGDPRARRPEDVADDVRDGYITVDEACVHYDGIVDPD
jgi:N-methylhydantoinase B